MTARLLLAIAAALSLGSQHAEASSGGALVAADWTIRIEPPDSDDGRHLAIGWTRPPAQRAGTVLVLRRRVDEGGPGGGAVSLGPDLLRPGVPLPPGTQVGAWTVVASSDGDPAAPLVDEVDPEGRYIYALVSAVRGEAPDTYARLGAPITSNTVAPRASWFHRARWPHLALIVLIGASLFGFAYLAKRRALFVRRLPGVDAIEDAVGRSTEMGRPILYVTGSVKTEDIQTIASILILGHVAEIAATYDTDLRVANAYPLTMVIAEEVVRQGYANAGRADAHRPEDVMFITSEQFAFAAAVNGMILRERPAANIFFGRFFAESLMLAETGYLTGAVQIAGTAELTQLPFFVSACDYTLIGEELFACSAYLTREPNQLAMLKAGDLLKVVIAVMVVAGTVMATLDAVGWAVPLTLQELLP
ncbi:MAG TPA: DUF6754 domain-containing protein [Kofleriaceae bacterium]|nr:DUF6754 domain-containing protein [Kofleriaceae bacterium]